jgi:hypothetical protein
MSLTIRAGGLALQDPSDSRVYVFDWDDENLPAGVEISGAAVWTITAVHPSTATLMTKDQESLVTGNRKAQLRLLGGVAGARYNIACKITTNETPAQIKEQSFNVWVAHR